MDYSSITFEITDGVCVLTLHRPDHLNAFTVTMMRELIDAFDRVDADDEVRVVIVTGAGRAFCVGADLGGGAGSFDYKAHGGRSELAELGDGPADRDGPVDRDGPADRDDKVLRDAGGMLTLRIFACTKPVIAAINGHAVGIGATMTLPMDIRIAANGAKMGFVFCARGIAPEACSSWFLPRLVGISQAAEWIYTSRVFPVAQGRDAGLIRSVHTPGDLMDVAFGLAREIAVNSAPVSVALSRMMLWRMLGADHPMEAHRIDSRAVNFTGAMPDAREGISSFFEKRDPQWSMSVADDMPPWVPWWDEPQFS